MSKLSDRVRSNSEAAPWVVEEIKRFESQVDSLQHWVDHYKSAIPKGENKIVEENKELQNRIGKLEYIIQETLWMARRYAHGRSTYAPETVNKCIDKALELGIDMSGPPEEMYASDGMFGKWNSELKIFEK